MKKLFVSIMILVLVLAFFGCQKKQEITTEESVKKEVEKPKTEETKEEEVRKTLKKIGPQDELLVHYLTLEPYYFFEEGKSEPVSGWYYELVTEMMKEMGQTKIKWVQFGPDAAKSLQDLKAGEVHMMPALIKREKYIKTYNFSDPISWTSMGIFVHKDSNIKIEGDTAEKIYEEMAGKTVAGLKTYIEPVELKLRELDKKINPVLVAEQNDSLDKLVNKEAEIGMVPYEGGITEVKKNNLPVKAIAIYDPLATCTAFSQQIDPEIVDRWNKAFMKLKESGIYERLNKKYNVTWSDVKPSL